MIIRKRVGKRGTKYSALVRKGGVSVSRTFNSRDQAKRWGKEEEDRISRGPSTTSDTKRTFQELLGLTVEKGDGAKLRLCCKLPPRECKCATYAKTIERRGLATEDEILYQLSVWGKYLGQYPIRSISPADISDARDRIERGISETIGRRTSGATINRYLAALSGFYKWIVQERGLLASNPVKSVSRGREPRGRTRYLSDKEREALFTACQEVGDTCPVLYPLVVVACYSGMRQGELLALHWSDIDLSEGWAYIRTSKNDEPRQVPIKGPALEALANWKRTPRLNLFGKVFNVHSFPQKSWIRALKISGVRNYRFHDCRHTAASYLVQSGAQLTDVAAILGHKTLAMSMKYSHLSPARKQDVMAAMVERFGK